MASEINLILSGTPMSGLKYPVDREWALSVSKEELVLTMRDIMMDLAKTWDMHLLLEMAKKTNLHIHAPYHENSDAIYICVCNSENH
jgi:hypothetical protein